MYLTGEHLPAGVSVQSLPEALFRGDSPHRINRPPYRCASAAGAAFGVQPGEAATAHATPLPVPSASRRAAIRGRRGALPIPTQFLQEDLHGFQ